MDIAEIVDIKLGEIMGREFFDAGFMFTLRDDELVELYRRYLQLMDFAEKLVEEFHFQTDVIKETLEERLGKHEMPGVSLRYRKTRTVKDYSEIVRRMKSLGYSEDALYEKRELGIGKIQKMLAKDQIQEIFDDTTIETSFTGRKIIIEE